MNTVGEKTRRASPLREKKKGKAVYLFIHVIIIFFVFLLIDSFVDLFIFFFSLFICVSPRAHLHVMGMLQFMSDIN